MVVSADTGAAEKALADLGSRVGGVGSAITTALGTAAVGAVAGLGAAFVGSVKTAADFEKQLSAIGAVSGATETELAGLRATALQLGKDTSFSASEAAAGMEEMVKAGVSLNDVMGGAGRAALDLAAAGGLSVAESATIASNAMNVFSLKGADMGHVADVIAGAANASAIDVHDFGFSLSAVGAVAATVGLGLEDTATAIAVLGQAGLKGSDAGTSLKTMLLNLNPTSKAARSEMKALGIITADGANQFFDATGKAKGLSEISQILRTSMQGLTKEQQINALQTAFGTDAVRAAAIMAKAGAEGFDAMADSMSKVTAQAVAEERLNNLLGSLEKLKGSLETGAIMLGSLFTPALKGWVDTLTVAVNDGLAILEQIPDAIRTIQQVLAGDWAPSEGLTPFMNAVGETAIMLRDTFGPAVTAVAAFITGTLVPAIQANIAPIAAFVAGFLGAVGAAGAVTAAIAGVAAVLALLLSPIGLVAVAVGLLAAAWVTDFGGIQEKTAAFWAWLQPVLAELIDWLGPKITAVLTWLTDTGWPAMLAAGSAVSDWIATIALPALTTLVEWLGPKVAAVLTWIADTGWPALLAAGIAVSTWITTVAIPALTELVDWLGPKIVAVTTWISETGWPLLVAAGTTVWTVVQEIIKFFRDLYVELDKRGVFAELEGIWKTLTDTGNLVWAMVQTAVGWWQELQEALLPIKASVDELVAATMLPKLGTDIGAVGTSTQAAISPVQIIGAGIQFMVEQVKAVLKPLTDFVAAMDALSKIKIPSFSLPGFGGQRGGTSDDPREYLRESALSRGIDPDQVSNVMGREGPGGWDAVGSFNTGTSYGPLQLHYAGGSNPQAGMGDRFTAMTGIDLRTDKSLAAQQRAIDFAMDELLAKGDYSEWYGADPALGSRFTKVARVPPQIKASQQRTVPQIGQQTMIGGTLTAEEAWAFCGPSAAMWFASINGRQPTKGEAEDMARQVGWTPEFGMLGPASQQALLAKMGVQANVEAPSAARVAELAAAGVPFQISTGGGPGLPGHYFQVQGGDLGGLNVGASGTALRGGSPTMSLDQITAMSGAMNGIITLAPQMGSAIAAASATGGTGLAQLGGSAQVMATTTTDAWGNVHQTFVRGASVIGQTITATSGEVVAQWGTMGAGMQMATDLMTSGALTSVTDLGTGILTSVQATGTGTIATVTDMSGQVTSQYATLANGVNLTMGDLAAGVTTTTTQVGDAVKTTVADMAGNTVTTVTDMTGRVIGQYVTLAADATTATAEMNQGVTGEVATMSQDVLTSVTDLGTGTLTITRNTAGETVATITDMAGNVTSRYTAMGSDVVATAQEMGAGFVGEMQATGDDIQGEGEAWAQDIRDALESIAEDAADQARQLGENITDGIKEGVQDGSGEVADAVADLVSDALEEGDKEAENGSPSKLFARELGLPIAQGVAMGIRNGAGEVYAATNDLVDVPPYAGATGGGGGGTQTLIVDFQVGGELAERIYITGRELSSKRGRELNTTIPQRTWMRSP